MIDKVIFLDVDNVLNNNYTEEKTPYMMVATAWGDCIKRRYTGIDISLVELINKILIETNAKLVLSSTWRYHPEMHEYMWKQLGSLIKERYIGDTPILDYSHRGKEIYVYLQENPIKKFVIIDDDISVNDYFQFDKEWIRTYAKDGITSELAEKAIKILNEN